MTPQTFQFVVNIIQAVGWWPPSDAGWGYSLWTGCSLLILAAMFSFHVVHVYESAGDLRVFAESCCLLLSLANLWFKILHVLAKRREVARLLARATSDIDDESRRRCGDVLARTASNIRSLGATFIGISYASALVWIVSPAVAILLDPGAPRVLPLKTWYPYDVLSSPAVYWGTYFSQVFSLWIVVSSYSALTTVYTVLVVAACARFQMVAEMLDQAPRHEKDGTVSDHEGMAPEDQQLNHIWIDCMTFHRTAFEYVKKLDEVFNPVVMVEFLTCLGIICQAGFLVVVKSKDTSDYIKYSGYLGTTVLELLLYCWHCNEIEHQSSAVQTAAYDSPWYHGSAQLKMAVHMMIARSQRRLSLTAGNMHPVSLDTFTGILRDSYSVFALLRQISDEE